jgi:excisionase family DNA binding protein
MTNQLTLTALEAALALGIRVDSLYPMLRSQRLPATRVDGQWRIDKAAVEERARRRAARRKHEPQS